MNATEYPDGLTERLLQASIDLQAKGVRHGIRQARQAAVDALHAAGMHSAVDVVLRAVPLTDAQMAGVVGGVS